MMKKTMLVKNGEVLTSDKEKIKEMEMLGKVVHCLGCSDEEKDIYHRVRLDEQKVVCALANVAASAIYPDETTKELLLLAKDINEGKYNLIMRNTEKSSLEELLRDSDEEDMSDMIPALLLRGLLSVLLSNRE